MKQYVIRTTKHVFIIKSDRGVFEILYPIIVQAGIDGVDWELEKIEHIESVSSEQFDEYAGWVAFKITNQIRAIIRGEYK